MTKKIASQLHEAYNNKGRTAKHLIPQGRIPDLGWNTDQQGTERQSLPNITPEAPVTQTTPEQIEGPPSSRLHSKTNIITPSNIMDPPKRMQTAFYWFLPCRDLLPVSLFCIQFPGFLVPRCALLFWGIFVRGLCFETFVRVLRSSELSLNNCK